MSLQTKLIISLKEKINNEVDPLSIQLTMKRNERDSIEFQLEICRAVEKTTGISTHRQAELQNDSNILLHQINAIRNQIQFCNSILNDLDVIDQAQVDLFIELTQGLDPLSTDHRIREFAGSKQ